MTKFDKEIFDKVKKGDSIKVTFDSGINRGSEKKLIVKSKNLVGKGKSYESEKITFSNAENPNGVKYYAFKRKDGSVGFAIGDMAISNVQISDKYAKGSTVKGGVSMAVKYFKDKGYKVKKSSNYWVVGGRTYTDEELVSLMNEQESFTFESVGLRNKMAKGSTVKGFTKDKTILAFGQFDFEQIGMIWGVDLFGLDEEDTENLLDELRGEWRAKSKTERKEILNEYGIKKMALGGSVGKSWTIRDYNDNLVGSYLDETKLINWAKQLSKENGENVKINSLKDAIEYIEKRDKNDEQNFEVYENYGNGGTMKGFCYTIGGL